MSMRSRSRCALAKVRKALQDLLPLSPLGINTAERRLRCHFDRRRSSAFIDFVTNNLKFAARKCDSINLSERFELYLDSYAKLYFDMLFDVMLNKQEGWLAKKRAINELKV